MPRLERWAVWTGVCLASWSPALGGEKKPPIAPADYAKWETLAPGASPSPDGKWLAYGITKGDGNYELRVRGIDPASKPEPEVIPFGDGAVFSDDSRWLACAVGSADDERVRNGPGRGGAGAGSGPARSMGLMELATRKVSKVENVAGFGFSKGGGYLAFRRPGRPRGDSPAPGTAGAGGGAAPSAARDRDDDAPAPGSDLVVRDLARGVDVAFGNVAAFAWQDRDAGHLLALIVHGEGEPGRSVQLYDPATGLLRVLDSGGASYQGLAWRKDSDDLAVLRAKSAPDRRESTQVVLAWKGVSDPKSTPKTLDPTASAPGLPADTRVVSSRALKWGSAGDVLFVGIKSWTKKDVKPADRPDKEKEKPTGPREKAEKKAEVSDVEVWHFKDTRIIPEQKLRADRDRLRSDLAAWWPDDGAVVPLGRGWAEDVLPLDGGKKALAVDETPHDASRMFGRPYVDVSILDTRTGARTVVAERLAHLVGASPGGRYILTFRDGQFFAHDVETAKSSCLTSGLDSSFANNQDDHPTPERGHYPIGGWTKGDATVLLHDRFDLWEVKPDGTGAARITKGREDEIEHRLVRVDGPGGRGSGGGMGMGSGLAEPAEAIDRSKPIYCALSGEWTKKQGFATIMADGDGPRVDRPVWLDRSASRLVKAKGADVLAYVVQGFDDSPDLFVADGSLRSPRQVTETNPFQKDHAWGRSELVEFANSKGERLQGALYYPADYEPGKTYPMVVYIYEKLSRNLHNYATPSERSPYNPSVFTARGYFFFSPDITFRPRDPGVSILDAVESGVKKVLESGRVDKGRVGVMGHSWGGYGTTYLATRSNLFAAAVAGAPLTDLVSMYGSVYWNNGMPETGHYETGQERMEVPFWEDADAYRRNSPIEWIPGMKVPLLVAFGDKDGAVDWHQGIVMYNLARRAGKTLVLLVYPGENHSLTKKANQVDYHRRINEWFDHHLKGAPAPAWISEGVEQLEAERARKAKEED